MWYALKHSYTQSSQAALTMPELSFRLLNCALHHHWIGNEISGDSCWTTVLWMKWIVCSVWSLSSGAMLCFELKKHNEANASLCAVTQQNSLRGKFAFRGRPQSLVDLRDTKWPLMWISNHSCSMSSNMHGLVENIKLDTANSDTLLVQVVLFLCIYQVMWEPTGLGLGVYVYIFHSFVCQRFWN